MTSIVGESAARAARVSDRLHRIVGKVVVVGCALLRSSARLQPPESIVGETSDLSLMIDAGQMIERVVSIVCRRVNATVPVQFFHPRESAPIVRRGAPLASTFVPRGYYFTAGTATATVSQRSLRAVRIGGDSWPS